MFCENCGKEIDKDSLFCEYCGHKNDEGIQHVSSIGPSPPVAKKRRRLKKPQKAVLAVVIIILMIAGYFLTAALWFGNNYYGQADVVISEMDYSGEQLIESINIDKDNNLLTFNFSDNNFGSVFGEKWCIKYCFYNCEENYCAYDSVTGEYSFESAEPAIYASARTDSNNDEKIENSITVSESKNFKENTVYCFNFDFNIGFNDDYGNPIRKLFVKTLENEYINGYIYQRIFHWYSVSDLYSESFSTRAYFLYENGRFVPISKNDNLDAYVNAVWQGTDLNLIKYDESGNAYLEGPVRTRETVNLGEN